MRCNHIRTLAAFAVCGALLPIPMTTLLIGCKTHPALQAGVSNADGSITNADGSVTFPARTVPAPSSTKNADGSLSNPNGSVTYPAGSLQASRESSRTTSPSYGVPARHIAPVTNPKGGLRPTVARVTIANGSAVVIQTTETLSASRNNVGDRFTGVLSQALVNGDETLIPRGTAVSGEVVAAKGRGRFQGSGDIGIELTSIGTAAVSTTEYEAMGKGRGQRTATFVGGGAGLGALVGGLVGGGKGALIGGLSGAGAGTAAEAYTGNRDVVIPSESVVTFRLTSPLVL